MPNVQKYNYVEDYGCIITYLVRGCNYVQIL